MGVGVLVVSGVVAWLAVLGVGLVVVWRVVAVVVWGWVLLVLVVVVVVVVRLVVLVTVGVVWRPRVLRARPLVASVVMWGAMLVARGLTRLRVRLSVMRWWAGSPVLALRVARGRGPLCALCVGVRAIVRTGVLTTRMWTRR